MTDEPKRYYVVIDLDGNLHGPFESGQEAAEWAGKRWPDIEQAGGDIAVGFGWDIAAIMPPTLKE